MFLRIFTLISICMTLLACNKPDPNPELKDPIYNDLNSRFASTNQALEAEKKALEGHEAALKDVIPQTGQILYAKKRIYDSQAKIAKLSQEAKYLELKIASRKRESKISYTEAFKKGEAWPNPSEFAIYESQSKLQGVKPTWDAAARVRALAPSSNKGGPDSESKGEKKAAEGSGGGHSGH